MEPGEPKNEFNDEQLEQNLVQLKPDRRALVERAMDTGAQLQDLKVHAKGGMAAEYEQGIISELVQEYEEIASQLEQSEEALAIRSIPIKFSQMQERRTKSVEPGSFEPDAETRAIMEGAWEIAEDRLKEGKDIRKGKEE